MSIQVHDRGSDSRNITTSSFEISGTGSKEGLVELVKNQTNGMEVLSEDYAFADGRWKCRVTVRSEIGIPGSFNAPKSKIILPSDHCAFGNV